MLSKITASTMRNGLILGAVLSAIFLLSSGINNSLAILGDVLFIYSIVMVYRMVVRFRVVENEGKLSYGHSLLYITLLFLYASIVSGVVVFVYCKFIQPNFITLMMDRPEIKEFVNSLAKQMHVKANELKQSMDAFSTPMSYTVQYMWGHVFLGLFIGVIMSIFTRKSPQPNTGEQQTKS